MSNKQIERCFLCGKTKSEVNKLLKGNYGYICDECIQEAYEVLMEDKKEEISDSEQMLRFRNQIFL